MRGAALPLLLLAALGVLACRTPPPPDPDGTRVGALRIGLDRSHDDVLDCERNDCADWYRTAARERGTLAIEVTTARGTAPAPAFDVVLEDAAGNPLDRARGTGEAEVRVSSPVGPEAYFFAVRAGASRETLRYRVRTRFEPLPPPPPPPPPPEPEPRFETLSVSVLEVEGWGDDTRAVLLEHGADRGLERGLRGRLVDGGETIGEIVVEEVYPEGSRARVEGALLSPVTPQTVAEIDVPLRSGVYESDPDR